MKSRREKRVSESSNSKQGVTKSQKDKKVHRNEAFANLEQSILCDPYWDLSIRTRNQKARISLLDLEVPELHKEVPFVHPKRLSEQKQEYDKKNSQEEEEDDEEEDDDDDEKEKESEKQNDQKTAQLYHELDGSYWDMHNLSRRRNYSSSLKEQYNFSNEITFQRTTKNNVSNSSSESDSKSKVDQESANSSLQNIDYKHSRVSAQKFIIEKQHSSEESDSQDSESSSSSDFASWLYDFDQDSDNNVSESNTLPSHMKFGSPTGVLIRASNRVGTVEIRLGDVVLFKSNGKQPPFIGIVEKFIEDDEKKIRTRWLYRQTDTHLNEFSDFESNELFLSRCIDDNPLETILAIATCHFRTQHMHGMTPILIKEQLKLQPEPNYGSLHELESTNNEDANCVINTMYERGSPKSSSLKTVKSSISASRIMIRPKRHEKHFICRYVYHPDKLSFRSLRPQDLTQLHIKLHPITNSISVPRPIAYHMWLGAKGSMKGSINRTSQKRKHNTVSLIESSKSIRSQIKRPREDAMKKDQLHTPKSGSARVNKESKSEENSVSESVVISLDEITERIPVYFSNSGDSQSDGNEMSHFEPREPCIGPEFQVEVPFKADFNLPVRKNVLLASNELQNMKNGQQDHEPLLVWTPWYSSCNEIDPNVAFELSVDCALKYTEIIDEYPKENKLQQDFALFHLLIHENNVDEALKSENLRTSIEQGYSRYFHNQIDSDTMLTFLRSAYMHGKDFSRIAKDLPSGKIQHVLELYNLWKIGNYRRKKALKTQPCYCKSLPNKSTSERSSQKEKQTILNSVTGTRLICSNPECEKVFCTSCYSKRRFQSKDILKEKFWLCSQCLGPITSPQTTKAFVENESFPSKSIDSTQIHEYEQEYMDGVTKSMRNERRIKARLAMLEKKSNEEVDPLMIKMPSFQQTIIMEDAPDICVRDSESDKLSANPSQIEHFGLPVSKMIEQKKKIHTVMEFVDALLNMVVERNSDAIIEFCKENEDWDNSSQKRNLQSKAARLLLSKLHTFSLENGRAHNTIDMIDSLVSNNQEKSVVLQLQEYLRALDNVFQENKDVHALSSPIVHDSSINNSDICIFPKQAIDVTDVIAHNSEPSLQSEMSTEQAFCHTNIQETQPNLNNITDSLEKAFEAFLSSSVFPS